MLTYTCAEIKLARPKKLVTGNKVILTGDLVLIAGNKFRIRQLCCCKRLERENRDESLDEMHFENGASVIILCSVLRSLDISFLLKQQE